MTEEQESQKTKDYLEFAVLMLWFAVIGIICYIMGDYLTFNLVAIPLFVAVAVFYIIEAKWGKKK